MSRPVKQVIVVRGDLKKLRRGKMEAQVAHASWGWLRDRLRCNLDVLEEATTTGLVSVHAKITPVELSWLQGNYRKIVLKVPDEAALLELYAKVGQAGLVQYLMRDQGLTEFNGVETNTALAIGPDLDSRIDPLTGHLEMN